MLDTSVKAAIIFRLLNYEDEITIASDYELTLEEVREVQKENIKTCLNCGKRIPINPFKRERLYCNNKCRTQYLNKHRNLKMRKGTIKKYCPICKREFWSYESSYKKYCSVDCYLKSLK